MAPLFLDRVGEGARLRQLLRARKSVLLTGAAGAGKSALLAELRRQPQAADPKLVFTSGEGDPADRLRQAVLSLLTDRGSGKLSAWLGLAQGTSPREARAALERKSAAAVRAKLTEALGESNYALVLDPAGFLSRGFYELLRDLNRTTETPLVLSARSAHMEDIGYATTFAWPREQRLELGPLPAAEAERLCDAEMAAWARQPANSETFRAHVLTYAAGNPGTLLGLLSLARRTEYWTGDQIKTHLLTVDFNLRGAAAVEP
ncbi:MAG TPA: ATP-binding protein [Candidatus Xenobia bacterium]|nr:ATP-binding protein [Candidatus Xenobia bacterium]